MVVMKPNLFWWSPINIAIPYQWLNQLSIELWMLGVRNEYSERINTHMIAHGHEESADLRFLLRLYSNTEHLAVMLVCYDNVWWMFPGWLSVFVVSIRRGTAYLAHVMIWLAPKLYSSVLLWFVGMSDFFLN